MIQAEHLNIYLSVEDLNKTPPCNPNPPDVGVISMFDSRPHSEHFSLNMIVDLSGLPSNSFLNISIIIIRSSKEDFCDMEKNDAGFYQVAAKRHSDLFCEGYFRL